ncbi:MAG TPA: glycoside hydrolase family 32 protein, partial [Acidobacteriota bacterium]|nr:glycoside hydrolase family 32 protein [Acidobacteriota bacterium]
MRKSLVLRAFGLIGLAAWLSLPGCARAERESSTEPVSQDGFYEETYRPRYHFTPPEKWMNDPNGMVYHDSEYHLFYQYNPEAILWGHMSWGHAVSPDMLHWQHLPVALRDTPEKMYFSGSAVFDEANSSGLGSAENPPLVAIYTAHMHSRDPLLQRQELAYSTDRGRTWTLYDGNPVLDIGESDFRDPKVFWHEASRRWIMAVSLANEKRIQFYSSSDLKRWDLLSQFGPAGAPDKHNWECPDLFELPVENGGEGETRWVLATDMGSAAIAGGSGAEYFVGTFDGTAFTGDDPPERVRWVDYGADFYASQSFSGIPPQDGRRIWLAWMNNWDYARDIPTDPWRGMMSIPRQLSLRRVGDDLMLVQRPVEELQRLRGPEKRLQVLTWGQGAQGAQGDSIEEVNRRLASQGIAGASLEIVTRLRPVDGQSLGLSLRQGGQEETRVGYDPAAGEIFVDRSRSGVSDFHEGFAARHTAPLDPNEDGTVTLHIFLDHSSVEVFAGDGLRVISDRIFPSPESTAVKLFGAAGAVEDL